MKMTANGISPARRTAWTDLIYHACRGTCLGIGMVLVGWSHAPERRKPYHEPAYTSGTWMQSHGNKMATRVPNGIAVLEACAQTNRLSRKTRANSRPGNRNAVTS